MPPYYQQNHNPYSPDVLDPHDTNLLWSRDWANQRVSELGEPFIYEPDDPQPVPDVNATVNARAGALRIFWSEEVDDSRLPRGRSFLLPDWTQGPPLYPNVPEAGGVWGAVFMAKVRNVLPFAVAGLDPVEWRTAGLSFGNIHMVGRCDGGGGQGTTELAMMELAPNNDFVNPPVPGPPELSQGPGKVYGGYFATATDPIAESFISPPFADTVYVRVVMLWSDKEPETEGLAFISRDGQHWIPWGTFDVEGDGVDPATTVLRRVGAHIRGEGPVCEVDWMRLYKLSFPQFTSEEQLESQSSEAILLTGTQTGARLFGR